MAAQLAYRFAMPVYEWAVDATTIKVRPLAGMLTVVEVGDQRIPIPPRTLGVWPLPVPDRDVRLETRRNLDVIRYVVVSDGHELPTQPAARRDAAPDARCTPHDAVAICRCVRCDASSCRACSPDGRHCTSCLLALAAENRVRLGKLRRFGLLGAFGMSLIPIAVGAIGHWTKPIAIGVCAIGLTLWLWARGAWQERADRAIGLPSAVDGPGVAVAKAIVVPSTSAPTSPRADGSR